MLKKVSYRIKATMLLVIVSILNSYTQSNTWKNFTNYNEVINDIQVKDDFLWIGTYGGLAKINIETNKITLYNKANAGLPGNDIKTIAIDNSGNIWMGTRSNGIGMFNGEKCIVFNTKNSELPSDTWNTEIAIDKNGNIWNGSLNHLSRFDGTDWWNVKMGDPFSSIPSIILDFEFDNNGNTWIVSTSGLFKMVGENLTKFNKVRSANDIEIDLKNRLWFGTRKGLKMYDFEKVVEFNTENSEIPGDFITQIEFDSKGNLWLLTNEGLAKFDIDNNKWYVFNSNILNMHYGVLTIDTHDNIWIGRSEIGLVKFDGKNWGIINLDESSISNNLVSSFAIDINGNKWIIAQNLINYFEGTSWKYFNDNNISQLDFYLERIYDDGNRILWKGENIVIDFNDSLCLGYNSSVNNIKNINKAGTFKVDYQGNIWQASKYGVLKYDWKTWFTYNTENSTLPTNNIANLAFDNSVNLLISTLPKTYNNEKGVLLKFDGTNWVTLYTCSQVGYCITGIETDESGNIWLGIADRTRVGLIYGGGLLKFDGITWTNYNIYNSGLPSNSVVELCLDQDENLWIGTYDGGLAKFDRKKEWTVFNTYNSPLPGNNIEQIEVDSTGNLWIGIQYSGLTFMPKNAVPDTTMYIDTLSEAILIQNYPNPFVSNTNIEFTVSKITRVQINIYDFNGRLVKYLVNQIFPPGTNQIEWDGRNNSGHPVSAGMYICILQTDDAFISKKMVLLK